MSEIWHKTLTWHNCAMYQHNLLNLMQHLTSLPHHLSEPKASITIIWLSLGAYFWWYYCTSKTFTYPPLNSLTHQNGPQFTWGIYCVNGTQCASIGYKCAYQENVARNCLICIREIVAREWPPDQFEDQPGSGIVNRSVHCLFINISLTTLNYIDPRYFNPTIFHSATTIDHSLDMKSINFDFSSTSLDQYNTASSTGETNMRNVLNMPFKKISEGISRQINAWMASLWSHVHSNLHDNPSQWTFVKKTP